MHTGDPPLELLETRSDGRTRLRLIGELDIATCGSVAQRLERLGALGNAMLLDLDDVTFIDACGARLIADVTAAARRDGWSLTITRGSRPVRRLFQLLDLADQLPYDDGMAA